MENAMLLLLQQKWSSVYNWTKRILRELAAEDMNQRFCKNLHVEVVHKYTQRLGTVANIRVTLTMENPS